MTVTKETVGPRDTSSQTHWLSKLQAQTQAHMTLGGVALHPGSPHPTPPLFPPLRVASTKQSWPPGRSCPSHPRARTGPRLLPCQGVRYLPLCLFPQVHGHLCDQSPSLAHTCLAAHPAGEVGLPATSFVIPEPGKPDPHLTPSFPPSDKSIKQSLDTLSSENIHTQDPEIQCHLLQEAFLDPPGSPTRPRTSPLV